jgi:hypothetical protein
MEEGNLICFGIIGLCIIFLLPFFDVVVILVLRYKFKKRKLAIAILLTGIAIGTLAGPASTIYSLVLLCSQCGENPFDLLSTSAREIAVSVLWFFYEGFGFGAFLASLIGIALSIFASRVRAH